MYSILFLFVQTLFSIPIYIRGEVISCVCTTDHCQKQQVSTCNTTSMCFSQYLDRRDGSDPLIKGCITSKTPLLCENRRPALHYRANWPVLSCCNRNLCNKDIDPSPLPPQQKNTNSATGKDESIFSVNDNNQKSDDDVVVVTDDDNKEKIVEGKSSKIFNSIYIIVLVVGICSLFLIGGVATLVLRRQSALYDREFGSIHRNGYLKGEPQEIITTNIPPKPIGGTYDNRLILNT